MTREEAHKLVDDIFDRAVVASPEVVAQSPQSIEAQGEHVPEEPVRVLPEGKRVVRTKSSGDRVYLIDEVKKTRQWVTNPEVLKSLGFEIGDVNEVDETEFLKYQMGSALYRVENE